MTHCKTWFIHTAEAESIAVIRYFDIEGDVLGICCKSAAKAPLLLLSSASSLPLSMQDVVVNSEAAESIAVIGYLNIEGDVLGMCWMSAAKAPLLLISSAKSLSLPMQDVVHQHCRGRVYCCGWVL